MSSVTILPEKKDASYWKNSFFGCSRSLKDPDAVCVKSEQYRDDPGNDIAEEPIEEPFNCRRTQRTNTANAMG